MKGELNDDAQPTTKDDKMTKRQKRLERLKQNPKNVTYEELRQVLEDHGFRLERSAGSHFHFHADIYDQAYRLSIPYKRPFIKAVYVRRAIEVIEEIAAKLKVEDSDNDTE